MSLNETPRSVRTHIALFGKRNAGKSSIINALTGQDIAIVSDVRGTTTDPVYKSMEILPIGPCVIIDTAGLDDEGELGELRKEKTLSVLNKTDISIIVIDSTVGITDYDESIINQIKNKKIPLIGVLNKIDAADIKDLDVEHMKKELKIPIVKVSALKRKGILELKNQIIAAQPQSEDKFKVIGDLINPGDFVVLVTPIDKAAPKGRLILPQQQTIRDILESDATAVVTKEFELRETLQNLGKKPKIVVTDSQAFLKVAADTPKDILMTSFSILFARCKGDLVELIKGVKAVKKLEDGDKVLIAEGCTHHRQSDDIGKVKIPRWIRQITGKKIDFEFSSGVSFTEEIKKYALVVHCGACMLNRAAMLYRINTAKELNVPIVNYGILIAYVQGILDRALKPFPLAKMAWDDEN
ncbi:MULTISPECIES: [FeFe] hydrogenase H-cluster maturation GTPase HydF [Clostridium]|uniref:Small GTP-binding protein domain protein n=4 Tax=Clostridium TaxID=1485 RepID=D8GJF2_CLOLD|nr:MULTISPECIES: [FeFe] hydrogenase H-cluster maturation GTPase HydF [Clostridium]ADK17240.1 Small GTP-binding protein domain protein [Clostridium ljungdahlii DSM 13528]AGY76282.1 [FeFe] hydrogenase H-cluster maturation GTPase HydF [Clostridium autoethanogenum DSM 10061]ALU36442.1 (FeFe)-hydrogenase H-cluster maturation GTPase HydF [Clostridium autoethanogenum DSM 10061]OAA84582.1 tRNA modification GTPase MnmE [Clostridium ljungdahlii DSM 13528]OAA93096.1 tRNA modification GTPase MnmE [Clostri